MNQTGPNSQTRPIPYKHGYEAAFNEVITKIVPPTPNSDNRMAPLIMGTGLQRGFGNAVLHEPPSPATPSSPHSSASSESSPGDIVSPVDGGSAELTLKGQQMYPWMGEFAGNSTVMQIPSESTLMPTRKERLDIKPLPQQPTLAPINQAHPYVAPPSLPLPLYPLPSFLQPDARDSLIPRVSSTPPPNGPRPRPRSAIGNTGKYSPASIRAAAGETYENLADSLPEQDLDEPVIEASSVGTSPTLTEAIAANESKQRLDRSLRTPSANMPRKPVTKLWESNVEVTADQVRNPSSVLSTPPVPLSEPKRAFREMCLDHLD